MFQNKQSQKPTGRNRQASGSMNEAFRRNNIVVSKRQRETALRQQSVTQRQADKKRAETHQQIKRRALLVIGFVAILTLGYRMSLTSVALQSNASARLVSSKKDQYEAAILKSYRASTIANQSWLLDTAALNKSVMSQFPEVGQLNFSTSAPLSTALKVNIRFRAPVFTWRDASNLDQFVDKDGVLFGQNLDPAVNTAKLTRIEDQSGTVLQAGTSVLTAELVQFVGQLHAKIPPLYGSGATISRVIIPKSTREVQMQVSGQPYLIKFSSTRDINEEVGELQSLLSFLKTQNVTPSAYIDLRVPHKAFYK